MLGYLPPTDLWSDSEPNSLTVVQLKSPPEDVRPTRQWVLIEAIKSIIVGYAVGNAFHLIDPDHPSFHLRRQHSDNQPPKICLAADQRDTIKLSDFTNTDGEFIMPENPSLLKKIGFLLVFSYLFRSANLSTDSVRLLKKSKGFSPIFTGFENALRYIGKPTKLKELFELPKTPSGDYFNEYCWEVKVRSPDGSRTNEEYASLAEQLATNAQFQSGLLEASQYIINMSQ